LIAALQALAKSVCEEPGCMAVEVYKTAVGSRKICYEEIWELEDTLRRMIASRHFSQLATLMELGDFRRIFYPLKVGFSQSNKRLDSSNG
jgi:quinol monooxygenase YgiN